MKAGAELEVGQVVAAGIRNQRSVGAGSTWQRARKFQRDAHAGVGERDGFQAILPSVHDGVALQKYRIKHGDFVKRGIEGHRGIGEGLERHVRNTRFRGQTSWWETPVVSENSVKELTV